MISYIPTYISEDIDEWKLRKSRNGDHLPPEEYSEAVFFSEIMRCNAVPLAKRLEKRKYLQDNGFLFDNYPLTPEEVLRSINAKPFVTGLKKAVRKYDLVILVVDPVLVVRILAKIIATFQGKFDNMRSNLAGMDFVTLDGSRIILVSSDQFFEAPNVYGKVAYRIITNVMDI